jgi:glutamyl-tRNA synthetase
MKINFLQKLFGGKKKVVTRIAPSPTGLFHIGTARSALFNYLIARKYGGTFIVRIEDTDTARSEKQYEQDILSNLEWLGLSYDALYRQSERTDIYTAYLHKLIDSGNAYVSKEKSTQDETKEVEVVRLKNKGEKVSFNDEIRGVIEFDTTELGDFVIARSLKEPLYHLAVVVDDYEMGVTHVIRGEDHISNTPRQILIQRALGISEPKYAHIPLILAPDRSKMSKRKGSTSVSEYRQKGYLKEALINYMAFLGWNPGTEKEVYSMDELIKDFSLEKIQKGGAIFDIEKLKWFNREHLRSLPKDVLVRGFDEAFDARVKKLPEYSLEMVERLVPTLSERVSVLGELTELSGAGEFDYFFSKPTLSTKLTWKEDSPETTKRYLEKVIALLEGVSEDSFLSEQVKNAIWDYATEVGRGSVLWPMRVALSGKEKSPDPFELAGILGKTETLARLNEATKTL